MRAVVLDAHAYATLSDKRSKHVRRSASAGGPNLADVGQTLVELGPNLAVSGQVLVELRRCRPMFVEVGPKLTGVGATLGRFQPDADRCPGQVYGRIRRDVGQT